MRRPKYRPATADELATEQLPPDPQEPEASAQRSVEAALSASRIPAGWGSSRDPYDPLD